MLPHHSDTSDLLRSAIIPMSDPPSASEFSCVEILRGVQTFFLIQAWRGLCPSTQIRVAGLALAFLARSVSFEVAILAGSWAIFFPYPKVINRLASLPSPLWGEGLGVRCYGE